MSINNPFNGGPDYPAYLANTFGDKRKALFCPAPASGGQQISIRLKPERLALVDILSSQSGWSRNQIIDAILDTGLRQLFNCLPEQEADEIINQVVASAVGNVDKGDFMGEIADLLREFNAFNLPVSVEEDKIVYGDSSRGRTLRITKAGQGFYLDDTTAGFPAQIYSDMASFSPNGRPYTLDQMLAKAKNWLAKNGKLYSQN